MQHEVFAEEDYYPEDEKLQATSLPRHEEPRSATISEDPRSPSCEVEDPSLDVLFSSSGYNEKLFRHPSTKPGREMIEPEVEAQPPSESIPRRPGISTLPGKEETTVQTPVDSAVDSKQVHTNASGQDVLGTEPGSGSASLATRSKVDRVDSANTNGSHSPKEHPFTRPMLKSPLRVDTSPQPVAKDSIRDSPTLSKHTLPGAEEKGDNIPPYEPTSPSVASPQNAKLPSFRQLTGSLGSLGSVGSLTELADAATQEMRSQQPHSHHHSRSFGSATSQQSPIFSHHPYPPSIQPSPQAYYAPSVTARSPASTVSESQHYGSPPSYPLYNGGFAHRRPSMAHDTPPAIPPSMPSASSSGESHGYPGSSTDGYSTNHTTPIDAAHVPDATPRPMMMQMLPPPNGMPPQGMIPGPFQCDVPGCNAGTFQTQYLLSSHKNVHSHNRPHYCSVEGCPRAEGGKGFKRKNEMIRHGLVHNSPGYICPFCPEREHKYPRPDNLQRHVRVHHVDKDKDDPQLREVLNQRTEGQGKTRRRRTGAAGAME